MIETSQNNIKPLKNLIWIYFWLLIFEGALRKWVLPGLATPLLLVRDPLALWLMFKASQLRIPWMNNYIYIAWFATALSFTFTLSFGHQNIFVAIFGARIMFIQFPLIFIFGQIFSKEDVLKMGRMLMLLSIPMTYLVALQFNSPQSAWVNRGIGGDVSGGGFSGAMGYFRPPATFSFISGTVQFYVLTACFIFYYWTSKEKCAKWLLFGSSIALLLAIPLCISRSLIFGVILVFLFTVVASVGSPNAGYGVFKMAFVLVLVLIVLQTTSLFNTGTEVMATRFENASKSEGGTIDGTLGTRFLGGFLNPIIEIGEQPLFDGKLGMGTNVGAKLITGGVAFLISEGEWGRLSGERGILLGFVIIVLRVILVVFLTVKSWHLVKRGEMLPWLILSFAFLAVLQGQWAQPSSLGFAVLGAGLVFASLKKE
jgi:hypothetical protein